MDPPLSPGFGPLGQWGARSPRARPPHALVCVYMPGSLQFTALFPACQEALAATQGLSPGEPSGDPLAPGWAAEALSSPRRGTVGGHRWPFSLSGFSKGYSPGWALCLLLLSDTNSCHGVGLGWDHAVELHTGSWSWSTLVLGGEQMGLPQSPPAPGWAASPWGSHCAKSPLGCEPGLVLLGGCGDASSVPWPMVAVTTGLSWALPLSFWGAVAPPGSPAVRVWLGGFGLCCCRPRPGL